MKGLAKIQVFESPFIDKENLKSIPQTKLRYYPVLMSNDATPIITKHQPYITFHKKL